VIVDDAGNAWLWDVDCSGLFTKITSNPVIMSNRKYFLRDSQGKYLVREA
jgi:hypothetical protein